jgi:hypothetical protein
VSIVLNKHAMKDIDLPNSVYIGSLVERLRKGAVRYHTYAGPVYADPTAIEREAADRISTLERELGEARAEIDRCHARLEIDHYWRISDNDDSDLERVDLPINERETFPDAVEARDEGGE